MVGRLLILSLLGAGIGANLLLNFGSVQFFGWTIEKLVQIVGISTLHPSKNPSF